MKEVEVKVYFETLGCAKNEVDSLKLKRKLWKNNFFNQKKQIKISFVPFPQQADLIILNTCGFILPAKEESINRFFELYQYKGEGTVKEIFLIGCLVERYLEQLKEEITETDFLIPISQYQNFENYFLEFIKKYWKLDITYSQKKNIQLEKYEDEKPYAYIKIAEGCSNHCSYCAIPIIRGNFRSFPLSSILEDIKIAKNSGKKEINLIAQDVTLWGKEEGLDIGDLVKRISEKYPELWIRLLYLHPAHLNEKILQKLKKIPNFLPYFDLPLQHIDDEILKHMNRKINSNNIRKLIDSIREYFPNSIIRTTFIVGHPLETEEKFDKLMDFIAEDLIERIGFFAYSPEENTKDFQLTPLTDEIIRERMSEVSRLYDELHLKWIERRIGEKNKLLIEEKIDPEFYQSSSPYLYGGRSYKEAPDDDPQILLESSQPLPIGKIITTQTYDSLAYNPIAKVSKNI